MSKGWDNATLKKLKALTGKGLSTAEIGKRLGMSKNAVVGKLNRLGWNLKASGAATAEVAKPKAAPVKKAVAPAKPAPAAKKTTVAKKPATAVKAAPKKATVTAKAPATKVKAAEKAPTAKKAPAEKAAPAPKEKKSSTKNLAMHQRIIQHSLGMAGLKPDQCRWPMGDPDTESFHFCGCQVFAGKPYCYEHCKQAYQFTPPKKK